MNYIIPRINRNGDRKETLVEELSAIRAALETTSKLLRLSSYANGRNYQLNPEGEARSAWMAHCKRIEDLERIAYDLLEIECEIDQQS